MCYSETFQLVGDRKYVNATSFFYQITMPQFHKADDSSCAKIIHANLVQPLVLVLTTHSPGSCLRTVCMTRVNSIKESCVKTCHVGWWQDKCLCVTKSKEVHF